jgi:hypothetical protein
MTASRRSEQSHELTHEQRSRGGLVRLVRLYRRKLSEQEEKWTAILMRQEAELDRVRAIAAARPEPPPPQPADVPEPDDPPPAPRGLSVAEQDALDRGLTGPPWWADREALDARYEQRRRDRYQTM